MTKTAFFDGDVVIAGGGLAGMTLALAMDQAGLRVALVDALEMEDQLAPTFDGRASALAYTSWRMFEALGVAEHLKPFTQRIEHILVCDGRPYGGDKPRGGGSGGDRFERPERPERKERPRHKPEPREPNAVVSEVGPRSKPAGKPSGKPGYRAGAGDPGKSWRKEGGKPDGKRSGPKGPPPPKGKASSKKNRARAAEAKTTKGGGAKPRRPKA